MLSSPSGDNKVEDERDAELAEEAQRLYPETSLTRIASLQERSVRQVRADIVALGGEILPGGGRRGTKLRARAKKTKSPKCMRCYIILDRIDEMYPDLCPECVDELKRGLLYVSDYADERLQQRLVQWGFVP